MPGSRSLALTLAVGAFAFAPGAAVAAPDPDVAVHIADDPDPAKVGTDITYTIRVSNAGPDPAQDVTLDDTLPPEASFGSVGTDTGDCTPATGAVHCDLGTLDADAVATVTIVVARVSPGTLHDTATVANSNGDSDGSNNTAAEDTTVNGSACTVTGTWDADHLVGSDGDDVLCGLGGDDTVAGGEGNDILYGGSGLDVASFADAPRAVRGSLTSRVATGQGKDELGQLEGIEGSAHDDVLRGDDGPNVLTGGGGVDLLYGRDDDDRVLGGRGEDFLSGGGGDDTLVGGRGDDTCLAGPDGGQADCHGRRRPDRNDTRGTFDLSGASLRRHAGLVIDARTFARWSVFGVWDYGFVIVHLDTLGDGDTDFFALIRSDGARLDAGLFRSGPDGDRRIRRLHATHPTGHSVAVRIPVKALRFDKARTYFRWWVQTIWSAGPCHRNCFDRVDDHGAAPEPKP
jgi:uncharacterized repeat protein (TIGR01451 family)